MIPALLLAAVANTAAPQLPKNCTSATAFVGTVCTPASTGKHPAMLLLGGSEGGNTMSHTAPQFADRGYIAASVAYFGLETLPQTLENVPVETVGKALEDISRRADVDPNRIAIMGISKGAEFALLAASIYPTIHAVIADVPSPFAWQGISRGPGDPTASWTLKGNPLPFVHYSTAMGEVMRAAFSDGKPLRLRKGYVAAMQDNKAQIPPAMFRLEDIHGPIMMLAADDDQIWDSVAQAELGMQYLRDHHHSYSDVYLHYPGAGHIFLFSSVQHPMTEASLGPMTIMLGGTAESNTRAAAEAWPRIYDFLNASLK